jgi:hypothetical protein
MGVDKTTDDEESPQRRGMTLRRPARPAFPAFYASLPRESTWQGTWERKKEFEISKVMPSIASRRAGVNSKYTQVSYSQGPSL